MKKRIRFVFWFFVGWLAAELLGNGWRKYIAKIEAENAARDVSNNVIDV